MEIIKPIPTIIIGLFLSIEFSFSSETALIFTPFFSSTYYSSGSVFQPEKDGKTTITYFQLGAKKNTGAWSISGRFQFITATNLDSNSAFFNPDFNFEHRRGYYGSDNTWFESSSLIINYRNSEKFSVFFGKDRVRWGTGRSNLILSNHCPTYPLASFDWKISEKLNLQYFIASLASQISDSSQNELYPGRDIYVDRSIAGHRLKYSLLDKLILSAIETVVFGNRKFDEHYLLPFIPFWSMQHYTGDVDNVQMCGEISWIPKDELKIYTSIFIDEWRPESTFDEQNRNWIGYQIGLKKNNFLQYNNNLLIEYTWTDHRIYRHKFSENSSYTYNFPLGFWAGPHAEEFIIIFNQKLGDWNFQSNISQVKRGELTEEMLDRQYSDPVIVYERYNGNLETRMIISAKAKKGILKNKLFLELEGQWIDWKNAGFDPYDSGRTGKDISKFSINLGLTASTQILFN